MTQSYGERMSILLDGPSATTSSGNTTSDMGSTDDAVDESTESEDDAVDKEAIESAAVPAAFVSGGAFVWALLSLLF